MKIRSDFVTNSSSSSYVIAYKSLPEIDEKTLKKYPFLKNYEKLIEKILFTKGDNDTTSGTILRTIKEYDENFISQYGCIENTTIEAILKDEDCLVDVYNKSIEYLENGFNILVKQVDYNDIYCQNMIYGLAEDKENFMILESD